MSFGHTLPSTPSVKIKTNIYKNKSHNCPNRTSIFTSWILLKYVSWLAMQAKSQSRKWRYSPIKAHLTNFHSLKIRFQVEKSLWFKHKFQLILVLKNKQQEQSKRARRSLLCSVAKEVGSYRVSKSTMKLGHRQEKDSKWCQDRNHGTGIGVEIDCFVICIMI